MNEITFSYADRPALHNISLHIPAGQRVALVGPSGAGKSTLAMLLLRFVDPQEGQVLVDDQPLSSLPLEDWRARVAWLPQNPYLLNDTVAANIRLAKPAATHAEVVQAAQLAHAGEFIAQLPQGFDTQIGEHGARLSGGQAQRIALARAFLKDAPFVILDEATANLDPQHEAWLGESLDRLLRGRTALIIAHRLNTVASADQVIVLSQGQVVQAGTHATLFQQDGLYRRLVSAHAVTIAAGPGATHDERASHPASTSPLPPLTSTLYPLPSPDNFSLPTVYTSLLRLARPFAALILLAALAGFATIASSIGLMTASAYIISAAALQPSIAELQVAIVGVRFFGIARGVFRYLERYLSHQVTLRLLARLRLWFYQALEPLAPARLLAYRSGDLLARILGDIASLENFYVRALAPPLVALLAGLAAGLLLAGFNPALGWVLLLFLALAGVGLPLLIRLLSRAPGATLVEGRAALSAVALEGLQGMPDLLACNQGARQLASLHTRSLALANAQRHMAWLSGLQSAFSSLLAHMAMWVVLILAIPLVGNGKIPGIYLAALALAALTAFEAAAPLPLAAQHMQSSLQAAGRLFEIVDAQPEVSDPPLPLPVPQTGDLHIQGLTFTYPGSDRPALVDLNLHLPQGQRLAVVGPSGAGKSTLLSLLLRFWETQRGQITLGGEDIRKYAAQDLRQHIAVVSQHTYLFSASLRDNLRLAKPEAAQEEIELAVQRAQLHEFIHSLPQGYDTWIGEHGLRLSAGERQRLAIARALLRNAPLLILDEATANLDALTERAVLDAIADLMQGRTTLFITHRLIGMEGMDQIIVLDHGRVIERGDHASLLAINGLYRRLWDLQHQILGD